MVYKCMKRSLIASVIRKMQIETALGHHFPSSSLAVIIKTDNNPSVGENGETATSELLVGM